MNRSHALQVLNIEPQDANDLSALRRAFHTQALQWHPDKNTNCNYKHNAQAAKRFQVIHEAYQTLVDECASNKSNNSDGGVVCGLFVHLDDFFNARKRACQSGDRGIIDRSRRRDDVLSSLQTQEEEQEHHQQRYQHQQQHGQEEEQKQQRVQQQQKQQLQQRRQHQHEQQKQHVEQQHGQQHRQDQIQRQHHQQRRHQHHQQQHGPQQQQPERDVTVHLKHKSTRPQLNGRVDVDLSHDDDDDEEDEEQSVVRHNNQHEYSACAASDLHRLNNQHEYTDQHPLHKHTTSTSSTSSSCELCAYHRSVLPCSPSSSCSNASSSASVESAWHLDDKHTEPYGHVIERLMGPTDHAEQFGPAERPIGLLGTGKQVVGPFMPTDRLVQPYRSADRVVSTLGPTDGLMGPLGAGDRPVSPCMLVEGNAEPFRPTEESGMISAVVSSVAARALPSAAEVERPVCPFGQTMQLMEPFGQANQLIGPLGPSFERVVPLKPTDQLVIPFMRVEGHTEPFGPTKQLVGLLGQANQLASVERLLEPFGHVHEHANPFRSSHERVYKCVGAFGPVDNKRAEKFGVPAEGLKRYATMGKQNQRQSIRTNTTSATAAASYCYESNTGNSTKDYSSGWSYQWSSTSTRSTVTSMGGETPAAVGLTRSATALRDW